MYRYYLWQQYILYQQYKQIYNKLNIRQEPIDISGIWNTNYYGRVIFEQDGNNVIGIFKYGNGRIEGTLNGNILTGKWFDSPTYECPLHSGKLRFTFSPTVDSFLGFWGECEGPLTKDWNGFRFQNEPAINVSGEWFTTNFGKIIFNQSGSTVTANYQFKNGKMEGKLYGYTFIGYWLSEPSFNCYYDKGRVEIDFDLKGESFTGVWDYCENKPERVFSGIRVDNRKYI